MKTLKKVLLSSLIMIITPSVLFGVLYGIMHNAALNDTTDYTKSVLGKWSAVQYYKDGQKFSCGEKNKINMKITVDSITVTGQPVPEVDSFYTWHGKRAIVFECEGSDIIAFISFDSRNNLRIAIDDWDIIMVLKYESEV